MIPLPDPHPLGQAAPPPSNIAQLPEIVVSLTRPSVTGAGTVHGKGADWRERMRALRYVVRYAVQQCCWSPKETADDVGCFIIDNISELDAARLHVLARVFGTLLRDQRVQS